MGDRLAGKVSLITGAGGGMGALAGEVFAQEGSSVVLADVDAEAAEAVAVRVRKAGGRAVGVGCDVRSSAEVAAAVAQSVEAFGGLHVLYNNAGVMVPGDDDPVATDEETWRRTLDVNLTGVFLGCKHAVPAMLASGGGSIVNVASFVAHMGAATPQIAYTASKGGVLAMTREVAAIYARQGIRANALCPGPVMTPLLAAFLADEAQRERRLVHIPMGRFGEAIEMVRGALFLASDDSSYMTGASLVIDGGITSTYVTPE
jgi:NAD(P)-dependent dehydrogenase (short-subunit alcohol dehydrogenase family)